MAAVALIPGNRLGIYDVIALLGEGGMGQVWRARDTQLNRDVALKVLPEAFAEDGDRLARFTREAQTLAALNHPNIAAIYGLEKTGELTALVMELVEGEDLSALIARGPIAPAEAVPLARQIAEALEAAHEQGIVHRDLKPANIKVRPDGTVKVLDFGLAKAMDSGTSGPQDPSNSPTLTARATQMGMILGTAAYMAPEQAKGRAVDKRADIWAFGVVLYEMLTGQRAFKGDDITETLASVLKDTPDVSAVPASVPGALRRLIGRCLERDVRQRLRDIGEARVLLDTVMAGAEDEPAAPAVAAPTLAPAWRRVLPWAVAGVLLVLLGYQMWPRSQPPVRPARLDVRLTPGEDLSVLGNSDGAIAVLSPDGETLVYLAATGTTRQLYKRRLDQLEATPLAGTEDAAQQFFSPDGSSIAFFASGQLMRMSVDGGAPTPLAPAPNGRGGSWGPDGTIVFTANVQEGLSRVSAAGGIPAPVTTLAPNERTHRWPSILPGGTHVLFGAQAAGQAYDDGTIEVARIATGERKVLIRGGTFPRYVGGFLVYGRGSTLHAVRFDADAQEVQGDPQPVLTGLLATGGARGSSVGGTGAAQVSIADNGTVAYLAGATMDSTMSVRLRIVDRSGRTLYEYPEPRPFRDPRLSPDGRQIVVRMAATGGSPQLHLLDPQRGTLNQITFEGISVLPAWSNDGRWLAFARRVGDELAVFRMPSDGTGVAQPLTEGGAGAYPTSFSPDDRLLALSREENAATDSRHMEVVSTVDGTVTPFPNPPERGNGGQFSPDGKWMTLQIADDTGIGDVYVRAYPGGGALRRLSTGGGIEPHWTRNGREIVHLDFTGNVIAVDVSPEGEALVIGNPHRLFDLTVAQVSNATMFDAAADGSRFVLLLNEAQEAEKRTHVTMVFNFLDELRRLTAEPAK